MSFDIMVNVAIINYTQNYKKANWIGNHVLSIVVYEYDIVRTKT